MTERYIYADVEKPFHFWVREGQRWILRDAAERVQNGAQRGNPHAGSGHASQGQGSGNT